MFAARRTTLLLLLLPLIIAAQDSVRYHWSGALSATSIRVHAMLNHACDSVRLVIDDDPQWASPLVTPYASADTAYGLMIPFRKSGLEPGTHYAYRFETGGVVDTSATSTGHFRTPGTGACSFSFTTGSCNSSGDHPVWQSMGWLQPLFFINSGDLHYGDPTTNNVEEHRSAYVNHVYAKPPMMDFLHRTPLAYVWDDHDFCGNGSYGNAPGKPAAAQAYREHVPHYLLADDTAVYQAFTIGRVHFILTDLRSTKDSTAMMSMAQRDWLHQQFLLARDSGLIACWATSLSWNSTGYPENWGSQEAERTQLADWLLDNHVDDLFMISGDAHMLAIDDGANCDFSTGQNSPYRYPILQAAALNRSGSYKGGIFDQGGYFPNPSAAYGQFGEVIVDDVGSDICITLNGWRTDSMAPALTLINSYTFCRTPQAIDSFIPEPIPSDLHVWYAADQGIAVEGIAVGTQAEVAVVDAFGRTALFTAQVRSEASATIATRELAAGAYIAVVRNGAQRAILKFVVE